jgi:DNA repair exonuclease SbcCD ATPase subunit
VDWDKLTIQNFLSIDRAEVELKDRGLILVEGFNKTSNKFKSNGSGKTSIFEAIVYALYDTTTKGLKADEVINNKTAKKNNCAVILEGRRWG